MKDTYYKKHKHKLKQSAIEYYKKNKILIKNGITKEKHPKLYEWYVQDMSNAVFKIRTGGEYYYSQDHTKYFKK